MNSLIFVLEASESKHMERSIPRLKLTLTLYTEVFFNRLSRDEIQLEWKILAAPSISSIINENLLSYHRLSFMPYDEVIT